MSSAEPPAGHRPRLSNETPAPNRVLIRRLLALGWQYRRASLRVVVLHVLLVGMTLGSLGLTGLAIDAIRHALSAESPAPRWPLGLAPPAHWSPMAVVSAVATVILGLALATALVRFLAAVAVADLTQRIVARLRSEIYAKLQRLSFRFYDANESSAIINRVAGDVQAVRSFVDGVIIRVLTVALTLAVYLVYMLSVHAPLTVACLISSPLLWLGAVVFSRAVQPAYLRSSQLSDGVISSLAENIQGIHVVKGFSREGEEIEKFRGANQRVRDQKSQIIWKVSVFQPLMGFVTQINMLVLLGYGGWLVVHGQLALGSGLFVFANLLHEFANQVGQITNIANSIQASLAGAQRVFEVLDAPVEVADRPGAAPLPDARGAIEFDRVSFAYVPGEPVLDHVSFRVSPGECLGIVGETGAGKSTLLSLICRFYDATAGAVRVDGTDVRDLRLEDLRRSVGLVFQESFLFSNTVAANIAFGNPDATSAQIERAARLASAREFVDELPDRYETVVGEHGANLSGGQRQRLAIARALLLDPPILILDDATASVDPETEHEIQDAVRGAMRGRTTVLVSNRVSSLRRADRILVLRKGRVVQSGTHDELLRADGYYRELAELQCAEAVEQLLPAEPHPRRASAGTAA